MALTGGEIALVVCLTVIGAALITVVAVFLLKRLLEQRYRKRRHSTMETGHDEETDAGVEPQVMVFGMRDSGISGISQQHLLHLRSKSLDSVGETVSPVVMEEIAKLATDSCEVNSHVTVGDAKNGGNSDSPSELISASAALQPCAEAVAEKARRMTIERSAMKEPEAETEGTPIPTVVSSSPPKVRVNEVFKRPRFASEVVPYKKRRAQQRVQLQQKVTDQSSQSKGGGLDSVRETEVAIFKRKMKKERSLSLPVISFDSNGACSFLLSGSESDESEEEGKIANPYFNMMKFAPSPAPSGQHSGRSTPGSHDTPVSNSSRVGSLVPMAGSLRKPEIEEIRDLTMSDPENDLDETEGRDILFSAELNLKRGKNPQQEIAKQIDAGPTDDSENATSKGRSISLQHDGSAAPLSSATPPPERDGTWKRGSRFKGSRRGSKKRRVRVVSRAVTFHSHDDAPRYAPVLVQSQTASLQSITHGRPSASFTMPTERQGSVVEVLSSDAVDTEDNTVASPGPDEMISRKIPRQKLPSASSYDEVKVPLNSPVSETDNGHSTELTKRPSADILSDQVNHINGLPMLVTNRQKRKTRERIRKKVAAVVRNGPPGPETPTGKAPILDNSHLLGSANPLPMLSPLDHVQCIAAEAPEAKKSHDAIGSPQQDGVSSDLPVDSTVGASNKESPL